MTVGLVVVEVVTVAVVPVVTVPVNEDEMLVFVSVIVLLEV